VATERALTEAEKMALVPGVEFVTNPAGRRPRLVGDLEIWEVIDTYHQCGDRRDAIRELFPHLSEQQVDTALAYYARFTDEIDAWIDHNYSWTPADIEALNEELGVARRFRTAPSAQDARSQTG
jgi:uncharacterized protein (DUF433 family)